PRVIFRHRCRPRRHRCGGLGPVVDRRPGTSLLCGKDNIMAQRTRRPLIGVTAGTRTMMSGAWAGHDAVAVNEHYVRALRAARRSGVPGLGICHGLQVIVSAEGGELHRHLPVDPPAHPATGQEPTRVETDVDAASDLGLALGTRAEVTAYHHQGIRAVRGDLRVVARHDSGLPLAVEADSGSNVLGVQWHPEIDGEGGAAVFESLLTAIRHRAVSAPARSLV